MTKTLLLASLLAVAGCSTAEDVHDSVRSAVHGTKMLGHLDRNHDGKVDRSEAAGPLADHLAELDTDGDGALDADELSTLAAVHADHGAQLFAEFDADGDDHLSAAELAGAPGPAAMCISHFAEIDADADSLISRDELAAAIDRHHHS